MKKFMCIVLTIVLVIMCGCSVARLYFDMRANQKIDNVVAVLANSATQPTESTKPTEPTTPTEAVPTPVYTYEHTAYNAVILESNTSTGKVRFAEVCPRCGDISSHSSKTVVQGQADAFTGGWCSECQERFEYRIGVIIHVDYQ